MVLDFLSVDIKRAEKKAGKWNGLKDAKIFCRVVL
jgi:hypothetical protein